jgi:hypothetical protein
MKVLIQSIAVLTGLGFPFAAIAIEPAVPPDLALLPDDIVAFVCVRPADLLAGDLGKGLRALDHRRDPLAEIMDEAAAVATGGIPLAEVERVTVFWSEPEPFWIVTAVRPFERARILRQFGIKAAATTLRGMSYHAGPENGVLFINQRTFLTGPSKAVARCFARQPSGKPDGLMAEALRQAAGQSHLVAGLGGPHLKGGLPPPPPDFLPPGLAPLLPLARIESGLVMVRFDKEFQLDFRCTFAEVDVAQKAEQGLRTFFTLAVEHLPELGEVLAERFVPMGGARQAKEVLRFFEAAEGGLKSFPIRREGKTILGCLRTPGRGAAWALFMLCAPPVIAVPIDRIEDLPAGMKLDSDQLRKYDELRKPLDDPAAPPPIRPVPK